MTRGLLRSWWPLIAVALLLALTAVAAAHSSPQVERLNRPDNSQEGPDFEERKARPVEQPGDFVDTEPTRIPGWLITAAVVIGVALIAVLLGVMVFYLGRDLTRRRRKGRMPPALARPGATADEVVAALDAGLDDLSDADRDPRRAVIACWLRLEQAAAAAGTPRQAADTPTDLVTRLLSGHHVSADVLAGFANVYREARYATHTVDERMRGQARAALQRLRGELTAEVPA
jgi:hypothetical protein